MSSASVVDTVKVSSRTAPSAASGDGLSEGEFVLYVTSSGGVLLDVLAVANTWEQPSEWVAAPAPDSERLLAGATVTWVDEALIDDPVGVARATASARRHLGRRRPTWVVSAGTALAVPWFVAAASLRIPSLWIETLNMRGSQGRAATICSRLAERVLVQQPEQLLEHRRAVLVGELY